MNEFLHCWWPKLWPLLAGAAISLTLLHIPAIERHANRVPTAFITWATRVCSGLAIAALLFAHQCSASNMAAVVLFSAVLISTFAMCTLKGDFR